MDALVKEKPVPIILSVMVSEPSAVIITVAASEVVSLAVAIVPDLVLPGISVPSSRSCTLTTPVVVVLVPITE